MIQTRLNTKIWGCSDSFYHAFAGNLALLTPMESLKNRVMQSAVGKIAVVSVSGILAQNVNEEEESYGLIGYEKIRATLKDVSENKEYSAVVLYMDSAGGEVSGGPELAKFIRSIEKPVIGYTDSLACSMGYYLLSACDYVACAPSAIVGSVGVYMSWLDYSKAMEMSGVKQVLIKSGEDKAYGLSGQMTKQAEANLNEQVELLHSQFQEFILQSRAIDVKHLQGLDYLGVQAKALGFVDGLYNTLDDLINEVTG